MSKAIYGADSTLHNSSLGSVYIFLDIGLFRNLQDWAETATIRVRAGVRVEQVTGVDRAT